MGWWWFIRNAKSPELPVILLEDLGAEIGLFLALGGLAMAATTGRPAVGRGRSISIGVLLVAIAMVLAVEMKGMLLGEAATEDDAGRHRAAPCRRHRTSCGLIHLRTMHHGPDRLIVAAKVEFAHHLSVPELAGKRSTTPKPPFAPSCRSR